MPGLYWISIVLGGLAVLVLLLHVLSYFIEGLSGVAAVTLRAAVPLVLLAGAAYLIASGILQ